MGKKNVKISEENKKYNLKLKRRIIMISVFCAMVLIALIIRLFWIQFIDGSWLKEDAYKQQTINRIISPKRGTIYDSTGKTLAISAEVDTVTINPKKIKDKNNDADKTKVKKEKVAKALSEIFELNYEEVLEKVNSENTTETIAKKVEQDKITKLEEWMEENEIYSGINIDPDNKRYYPYNNLAAQILGFCGTDDQGLFGIESYWDDVLKGVSGKITTLGDAVSEEIPDTNLEYIPAENGSNITLTLDIRVQTVIERYLKQAVEENNCEYGGNVIVMNPQTGDILGMATYPDYNLNTPFTPNTEELVTKWDTLSSADRLSELNNMWTSKSIGALYEPGSTFKVITAAIALEENLVETDTAGDFYCSRYETVNGEKIYCWRDTAHGSQTLRQALGNSCNPSFIQLGQRIGAETLYKYYKAFGLMNRTGVAISGEQASLLNDVNNLTGRDLASISFGQGLSITPLQLITAVSAVVNDGVLMKPRIVKQVTNSDTGAITNIEPEQIRQVISKETSEKIKDLMESVVTDGTGWRASVTGYSIGGKSGTSESLGNPEQGYVASYLGIAPAAKPEIAILVTLYKPQGSSYQGGQVAGPVVSQMLSEILPDLGIASETEAINSGANSGNVLVPEVRNKTVTEAKKALEDLGLKCIVSVNGDKNTILATDQMPKPGVSLAKGSVVALYTEENEARTSVTVPDLRGMSLTQAKSALKAKNLNITYEGSRIVTSQSIAHDSSQEIGTVVHVVLKQAGSAGSH